MFQGALRKNIFITKDAKFGGHLVTFEVPQQNLQNLQNLI